MELSHYFIYLVILVVLGCISMMVYKVKHIFLSLLVIWIFFKMKYLFKPWWEWKIVQLLWKTIWMLLKNLKTKLLYYQHPHERITSQRLHIKCHYIGDQVSTYKFGGDTDIQSTAQTIPCSLSSQHQSQLQIGIYLGGGLKFATH